MAGIERIREYIENVADWTCLEKINLSGIIIGVLVFDFVLSLALLFPSTIFHFLYVNPAGRVGFVGQKWIEHVDIYHFRREQEWEQYQVIDWEEADRFYVNETRNLMDETCSTYENKDKYAGDPGDYIKEVAGHPNESGYNNTLRKMISMFMWGIACIYFSCPVLLLALWWKRNCLKLVILYIIIQFIPMVLFAIVTDRAGQPLMCAIDIIYGHQPIWAYLISFTVLIWIYFLVKFVFLLLYCIEQYLIRKRKDFGFRRKRKNKVAPAVLKEEASKQLKEEEESKLKTKMGTAKKSLDRKRLDLEKGGKIQAKKLAREILELGTTTEEEAVAGPTETDSASANASASGTGSRPGTDKSSTREKKGGESQLSKLAKRQSDASIDEAI